MNVDDKQLLLPLAFCVVTQRVRYCSRKLHGQFRSFFRRTLSRVVPQLVAEESEKQIPRVPVATEFHRAGERTTMLWQERRIHKCSIYRSNLQRSIRSVESRRVGELGSWRDAVRGVCSVDASGTYATRLREILNARVSSFLEPLSAI